MTKHTMPERTPGLLRFELESIGEEMSQSEQLVKWLEALAREFKEQRPELAQELGALQTRLRLAWSAIKREVKRANQAGEVDNTLVDSLREFDAEKGAVFRALRLLALQAGAAQIWEASEPHTPFDPARPLGAFTLALDQKSEREKAINGYQVPKELPHPTFMEARQVVWALSDGRDGRNWNQIEGAFQMFHQSAPGAPFSVHLDPSKNLLNWWQRSAEVQLIKAELENMTLAGVSLFCTVLSWLLESGDVNTSLDELIAAIGRQEDARRSRAARHEWRENVWRWLLVFESLAVKGARPGIWREPEVKGEKRRKIPEERLTSEDPLLLITGRRFVAGEEGEAGPLVPKEISLTLGAWAKQFKGNREILTTLGNVRDVAAIPCGKPSGDWAACAGLVLLQLWREQATKGAPSTYLSSTKKGENDKKGPEVEALKTRHFTRRELLARSLRPDCDVQNILKSDTPRRAKEYWTRAMKELEERNIIGFYEELEPLGSNRANWQEAWLDQPLDIRPAEKVNADVLSIHKSAKNAREKGTQASATRAKRPAKKAGARSD